MSAPSLLKKKRVFTPSELERAKADLIERRLGVLPVEVTENGYYYDPHEFVAAMDKKLTEAANAR
jgi:hypothetical protein